MTALALMSRVMTRPAITSCGSTRTLNTVSYYALLACFCRLHVHHVCTIRLAGRDSRNASPWHGARGSQALAARARALRMQEKTAVNPLPRPAQSQPHPRRAALAHACADRKRNPHSPACRPGPARAARHVNVNNSLAATPYWKISSLTSHCRLTNANLSFVRRPHTMRRARDVSELFPTCNVSTICLKSCVKARLALCARSPYMENALS